jgi:hypothetical protein
MQEAARPYYENNCLSWECMQNVDPKRPLIFASLSIPLHHSFYHVCQKPLYLATAQGSYQLPSTVISISLLGNIYANCAVPVTEVLPKIRKPKPDVCVWMSRSANNHVITLWTCSTGAEQAAYKRHCSRYPAMQSLEWNWLWEELLAPQAKVRNGTAAGSWGTPAAWKAMACVCVCVECWCLAVEFRLVPQRREATRERRNILLARKCVDKLKIR